MKQQTADDEMKGTVVEFRNWVVGIILSAPILGCTTASVTNSGDRRVREPAVNREQAGNPSVEGAGATDRKNDQSEGNAANPEQSSRLDPGQPAADNRQRLQSVAVPSDGEVDAMIGRAGGSGDFISVAHLSKGGTSADLEVYRYGVTKALNSVSTNPQIIRLQPVDPAETVYRFNAAEFKLGAAEMNAILAAPGAQQGIRQVGAARVFKADWLVYAVTRPEIYDRIMRIPNFVGDLERQIGADLSRQISAEVGDGQSEVTFGRRTLARVPIDVGGEPGGYYWRSIDYFQALEAGEFFFSLPNGLQGYMLSGFANQHRIDAQPFVATDRNRPQDGLRRCVGGADACGYVINGESCITCHANGVKTNKNFINFRGGTQQDFERVMAQDADRFARALAKMGFDSVGVEPVLETLKAYRSAGGNIDRRQGGSEVNPVFVTGGIFQR